MKINRNTLCAAQACLAVLVDVAFFAKQYAFENALAAAWLITFTAWVVEMVRQIRGGNNDNPTH